MLAAGVVGGPGLGYAKDRFAGAELQRSDAALYATAQAGTPSSFLIFDAVRGIDGKQLSAANDKLAAVRAEQAKVGQTDPAAALAQLAPAERTLVQASIAGDRQTLRVDSVIPAAMAVLYLLLALWFQSRGGYRVLQLDSRP
jgi:hypothetical protein